MDATEILQQANGLAQQSPTNNSLFFGLSMWGIIATLIFSGVGFIYFRYGKSTNNIPMLACGILLLGYPYIVTDTTYIVVIGVALFILPKLFNR